MNRRSYAVRGIAAAAVAVAAAALVPAGTPDYERTIATTPAAIGLAPAAPRTVTAAPRPRRPAATPQAAVRPQAAVTPVAVAIPRIKVRSSLERLRVDRAGELGTPVNAARAGWFVDGALPGEIGPAVIAGHVDSSRGPAVFWRLHELRSGDFVWVTRSDRTVARFRVVEVAQHPRAAFPTARVYGPTPEAALRLITCAGDYDRDRGEYRDNIVVYAVRA